ncbi:hypothetical protein PIB30_004595 [Stylosanthes scabra]|uniref:F-box domain-containing protein n=1 Tax=Stylosanthes scabra TaxID=79078 RepID=A0ABU6Z0S7_9FABA|nr:hypothetical protein [Stylosanthes scabra]
MEKSVDRISQLPEPVICEILSWLPIRDSIATCFLSRSWRHRWEDLQAFNFSTLPFLNQEDFLDEQGRTRFHAFVNGVLLHHRSATTVRKLIIHHHKFNPHFDGAALKAWFRAAIGPHLEELKLKLEGWKFMVPSRLFTCCTSLVNLQLSYCFRAERLTQNKVRFPSLKNLKLGSCNPKLVNKILSGSPILETLDLRAGRKRNTCFKNPFSFFEAFIL